MGGPKIEIIPYCAIDEWDPLSSKALHSTDWMNYQLTNFIRPFFVDQL